jgi:transcriptional regulator with XRE-family HTH domain
METTVESTCLCKYLHTLVDERKISLAALSFKTGICPHQLNQILDGDTSPTIEELICIGNVLEIKLTYQKTFSFAHQKIFNQMDATPMHATTHAIVKHIDSKR